MDTHVTDVYLFALTKNNSTGRLVGEASFKQAWVVVWKLSIFCRLLVQVWSVNVWTTFSIFHKLWNSMPSFLLSRFTATKPSGGNIKRHLSSLKHLSSVFTNGFMSTVDVPWLNLLSICFQANSSLKLRKQNLFSVSAIRQPSTLAAVEKNRLSKKDSPYP